MKAKFTYLVGPTYLIEIGSFRFLSDPGFDPKGTEKSEGPGHELKKNMAPPIPVEEIGKIDAVFVSHAHHFDNLDNSGKAWLPKWGKILTDPNSAELLSGHVDAEATDWTDSYISALLKPTWAGNGLAPRNLTATSNLVAVNSYRRIS